MRVQSGPNTHLGIGGIVVNKGNQYTIKGRVIRITRPTTIKSGFINITDAIKWVVELAIVPLYARTITDKTQIVHILYSESLKFGVNNYINIHNATRLKKHDNLYLARIKNTIVITSIPVLPF